MIDTAEDKIENTAMDKPVYHHPVYGFPAESSVPEEYYQEDNPWTQLTVLVFYKGIDNERVSKYKLRSKFESNEDLVYFWQWWRSHLGYTGYDHDYKIAACAYVLSKAFEIVDIKK